MIGALLVALGTTAGAASPERFPPVVACALASDAPEAVVIEVAPPREGAEAPVAWAEVVAGVERNLRAQLAASGLAGRVAVHASPERRVCPERASTPPTRRRAGIAVIPHLSYDGSSWRIRTLVGIGTTWPAPLASLAVGGQVFAASLPVARASFSTRAYESGPELDVAVAVAAALDAAVEAHPRNGAGMEAAWRAVRRLQSSAAEREGAAIVLAHAAAALVTLLPDAADTVGDGRTAAALEEAIHLPAANAELRNLALLARIAERGAAPSSDDEDVAAGFRRAIASDPTNETLVRNYHAFLRLIASGDEPPPRIGSDLARVEEHAREGRRSTGDARDAAEGYIPVLARFAAREIAVSAAGYVASELSVGCTSMEGVPAVARCPEGAQLSRCEWELPPEPEDTFRFERAELADGCAIRAARVHEGGFLCVARRVHYAVRAICTPAEAAR